MSYCCPVDGAIENSNPKILDRVIGLFNKWQIVCSPDDLHLDIGSPSQAHADAIRKTIGSAYVGIGLHAGDRRQFHSVGPSEPFAERLDQIVGGRNVVSITLLDVIERAMNIESISSVRRRSCSDEARLRGDQRAKPCPSGRRGITYFRTVRRRRGWP